MLGEIFLSTDRKFLYVTSATMRVFHKTYVGVPAIFKYVKAYGLKHTN